MRRERVESVKDMRRVQDSGTTLFRLLGQKVEQARADQDVQVDGDLSTTRVT